MESKELLIKERNELTNRDDSTIFNQSKRINIIDFVRGLAIINMVLYHLLYDLVYIYGIDISWFKRSPGYYWQQYICWSFILVSGISMSFSKDNLRRGLKIMGLAILITVVTTIAGPEMSIKFGILHFIASGLIITHFIEGILLRIKPKIGLTVSFIVFLITKHMVYNQIRFFEYFFSEQSASKIVEGLSSLKLMFIFGFPDSSFSSADYFPIIPWIFLLWTGYFAGKLIKENIVSVKKIDINTNIISKIGMHSLLIYMIHQVIIMGVLYLVFNL